MEVVKIENDYQNFIERMGSFEDAVEIPDSTMEHTGVLGMKWGKHKSINTNTVGAAARTAQSATTLGQTINRNTNNTKTLSAAKKLTDDDLKQLTNRLNLENSYVNAQSQQSGKNHVESILSIVGGTMAFVSSAAIMVDVIRKAKG